MLDILLDNKTAILYGAGGHIGRAVAQVFAREGAKLFLTGRDSAPLEAFADELGSSGGKAEIAEVDALDAGAVEAHLAAGQEGMDYGFAKPGRNTAATELPLPSWTKSGQYTVEHRVQVGDSFDVARSHFVVAR